MANRLSDEKIERIIEVYKETEDLDETANETGHARNTVEKYVTEWRAEQKVKQEEEEEETGEPELDFSQVFSTQTEAETGIQFSKMDTGEFIEWFFEEDLEEIDVSSVGLFARRCRADNVVPTERKMGNLISQLPSDIGNQMQIDWIAAEYWRRAKEYIASQWGVSVREVEEAVSNQNAGWVSASADDYTPGGPERNTPDGVVEPHSPTEAGHQPQGGTALPPQNPPQNGYAGPQTNPQQVVGPQQTQNDPTAQMMQQMMQEMREERQQMLQLLQQQNQQESETESEGFTDNLRKLAEVQAVLEDLKGKEDDDVRQIAEVLGNEIKQIKQQIASDDQQTMPQGDPLTAAFVSLAGRDDIDPETLAAVATNFGVESDPEVKKAEIQKETELEKMRQRQEMYSGLADSISELTDNADKIIDAAISGQSSSSQPQEEETTDQVESETGAIDEDRPGVEQEDEEDDFTFDDYADDGVPSTADGIDPSDTEMQGTEIGTIEEFEEELEEYDVEELDHEEDQTNVFEEQEVAGKVESDIEVHPGRPVGFDEAAEIVEEHGITTGDYLNFKHKVNAAGYSDEMVSKLWESLKEEDQIPVGRPDSDPETVETDGGKAEEE